MYIVPSIENLLVWDAVFFVHQGEFFECFVCKLTESITGYYTDSILKFRLTFPADYPDKPPVVQFLTDVFHPLISQQTGVFNLAPRFRLWRC
jgi:ubiquitin-protein ligase